MFLSIGSPLNLNKKNPQGSQVAYIDNIIGRYNMDPPFLASGRMRIERIWEEKLEASIILGFYRRSSGFVIDPVGGPQIYACIHLRSGVGPVNGE